MSNGTDGAWISVERYFQQAQGTVFFVEPPIDETVCKIFKLLVLFCRHYGGVSWQKRAQGTKSEKAKEIEINDHSWQDLPSFFSFLSNLSLTHYINMSHD